MPQKITIMVRKAGGVQPGMNEYDIAQVGMLKSALLIADVSPNCCSSDLGKVEKREK